MSAVRAVGRPVLAVGDRLRWDEREWTLAALDGPVARLVEDTGTVAAVLLAHLLTGPGFEAIDASPRLRVPQAGLLDTLPAPVRERALVWEKHLREIETGSPASETGGPRATYDPARTTLAQREAAKAAELTAAGTPVSAITVRRMRARYRQRGVWGLVDQRTTRYGSPVGRADPRVVAAISAVLGQQRERSTGTLTRLRDQVRWHLDDTHGPGVVPVPPASTFNRLLHALGDGKGLLGTAVQRRSHAARPEPPFTATVALRPGELVMMDSTALDVMVVLEDGTTDRPELSIALDVATRTVCAVLRPVGTKTVDAAVLLAQLAAPLPMHPDWDPALALRHSPVPFERLLGIDERLQGAAARPVIVPETVVVDQGRIFVSQAFQAACASLGVSLQPVPPANGPAKGPVERTFKSIAHGFCQYVAGYTGSNPVERGRGVEHEATWTLAQLRDFLQEWLVHWHTRKHDALRHPLLPALALSPIEMWTALINITGYAPLPLTGEDHIELLPVRWQPINDYGIRFDYRTYDAPILNGRRRRTSINGTRERFEVHHNPYDPTLIWVRLDGAFQPVPWIHATQITAPFTDSLWRHIRTTHARTTGRDTHELALARALDQLLKRVAAGHGTRRQRRITARATTTPTPAFPPALASDQPGPADHDNNRMAGLHSARPVPALDDDYDEDEGEDEGEDDIEAQDAVDAGAEYDTEAEHDAGSQKNAGAENEAQQDALYRSGPRTPGGPLDPRQEANLWL